MRNIGREREGVARHAISACPGGGQTGLRGGETVCAGLMQGRVCGCVCVCVGVGVCAEGGGWQAS